MNNLSAYLGLFEAGDLGAMVIAPKAPAPSSTPSAAVIASYCDPTSEFYSAELCARYRGTSVSTSATRSFTPATLPALRTAATNTKVAVPSGTPGCPACPTCPAPAPCPTCPAPTPCASCPTCPATVEAGSSGFPWWLLILAAGAGYYFGKRG